MTTLHNATAVSPSLSSNALSNLTTRSKVHRWHNGKSQFNNVDQERERMRDSFTERAEPVASQVRRMTLQDECLLQCGGSWAVAAIVIDKRHTLPLFGIASKKGTRLFESTNPRFKQRQAHIHLSPHTHIQKPAKEEDHKQ